VTDQSKKRTRKGIKNGPSTNVRGELPDVPRALLEIVYEPGAGVMLGKGKRWCNGKRIKRGD
jgi:hypothetical protein